MNDELVKEVKKINDEERVIRERKFEVMRKLGTISWEAVQSQVISHMEENCHGTK